MKLAVYAIAKNEAKHAARWYESVKDADEIVVLDTGSTDGTQKILSDLGVRVNNMAFEPFRFDTARNAALNQVSLDADYCMFIDLDETMVPGTITQIKQAIEEYSRLGTFDSFGVRLVFSFDEVNGKRIPNITYTRECIHTRQNFYWKFPVHEMLGNYNGEYKFFDLPFDVFHEPDTTKDRSSYLDLLLLAVEENPDDARQAQYLGREYMYRGDYLDAIMWLRKHINMELHGPFRSESATYISRCYQAMDGSLEEAMDEAEAWMFRAVAEFGSAREPHCELAHMYFTCGEWESAIGVLRSALRITEPSMQMMIHEAKYYGAWPYHLLASCYHAIGNDVEARKNIQHAMQLSPVIDGALATDLAKILGLSHVSQSLPRNTAEKAQ